MVVTGDGDTRHHRNGCDRLVGLHGRFGCRVVAPVDGSPFRIPYQDFLWLYAALEALIGVSAPLVPWLVGNNLFDD